MMLPLVMIGGGLPRNSLDFDGSTDYLSMSNANWGAYDRSKFAIALSIYPTFVSNQVATIYAKYVSETVKEFQLYLDDDLNGTTSRLVFNGWDSSDNVEGSLTSNAGVVNYGAWNAILVVYDVTAATPDNRIRMFVNGAEITDFTSRQNPVTAVRTTTGLTRIAKWAVLEQYKGLLYQPTFFSGTVPNAADIFDGTAGKLKNLSGLPGAYSLLDGASAVNDKIRPDWTNNGTVTTSATIPT